MHKPNHNVELAKRRLAKILDAAGADRIADVLLTGEDGERYKLDEFPVRKGTKWKDAYARFARKTIGGWAPPPVRTYEKLNPAEIPSRPWVIFGRYARGEATAFIGPPGVNKSMQILTDAVQIATGKSFFGERIEVSGDVLLLVGEDAQLDLDMRIAAIAQRYDLKLSEFGHKIHTLSLPEIEDPSRYSLGQMEGDVAVMNQRMLRWLREFPDVVFVGIDPVMTWHQLIENSNPALQVLCNTIKGLATQTKCAYVFDHHINKVSMNGDSEAHVGNLAAIRGGTVIAGAIRWAFTHAKISAATAKTYGIPEEERWLYRRFDYLKASYGPDKSEDPALLFKIEVERLPNRTQDKVAVLTHVDPAALRVQGTARAEQSAKERTEEIGLALAAMLDEKAPRTISNAAKWFCLKAPKLFTNQSGRPLGDRALREKLTQAIGDGITVRGPLGPVRIIAEQAGNGKNAAYQIDFAATEGRRKGAK